MDTRRIEAFADGVFAIAATLLVLDVGVAGSGGRALGTQLAHAWPSFVAYAVSFLTIGIMWVNHHTVMHQIANVDRVFLFLNVGLLMCVAFVPFPTRLVAENIRGPGARASALAYGFSLTVTAVMFNGLWFYASRGRRLLREDADARTVSGITRSYLPGPWIYLAATLVGFASPATSVVLYGAIALFYVVESTAFGGPEP
jgi:uncharacterized membrane protein